MPNSNLILLRWKIRLRALLFKGPESITEKERWPEFGVEFLIELGLALYQLGAEQMDLRHNFTVGLMCWIVSIGIGLRMFWILPWLKNWSSLLKAIVCFVMAVMFIAVEYPPVLNAYKKTKDAQEEIEVWKSGAKVEWGPIRNISPPTESVPFFINFYSPNLGQLDAINVRRSYSWRLTKKEGEELSAEDVDKGFAISKA